jgi:DNA polymerase
LPAQFAPQSQAPGALELAGALPPAQRVVEPSAPAAADIANGSVADRPAAAGSEKQAQLAVINEKVRRCTRCAELASTRTQTVFGVGNPSARIVFVGEAPGADEDRQGEPFVGRAGQLLNQIITACRLKREELYICNVLKCRPPQNRPPTAQECANCAEYLAAQLAIIDPDYIVCWGTFAAQNVLKTTASIGKLRQRISYYGRAEVVCTYHPSYLLRAPAMKKECWEDMKFFMARLGVDLTRKPGA